MATRAIVFAYHDVGVRCLRALVEGGVEVPLVLTHRDDPGEKIWFASVAELAADLGIETIFPDDPNTPEVVDRLLRLAPDFLFSFYYRRMLSPQVLAIAKRGAFNLHGSLLPKYRGRVPVNWAVLKGERETGATLHEMVAKPDAGRVVDQQSVPIDEDDLAVDVFRKVTGVAETVLRRSLPRLIDGSVVLRPQDLATGSYFGGRKPEDGRIDWTRSAAEVHNLVRAVAPPYPGAFTDLAAGRLYVLRTRRLGPFGRVAAPSLLAGANAPHVTAVCGDGEALALVEFALDGDRLTVREFVARFGTGPIHIS
ncbi:MAG: formyltransferase [Betaproteobacteria bacterium]|nr:formyltransferase [Betaproteobacteria bacterium]